MDPGTTSLLVILVAIVAALFASVGHAGATGYLAAMALLGVSPELMRPTALSLNILVAMIATMKFYRVGRFSWPIFLPLVALSIPAAFLGGALTLPATWYQRIVGLVLLYATVRLIRDSRTETAGDVRGMPVPVGLATGGGIGFLSGLTGIGGGIFLSPVLVLGKWADMRTTSGLAAAFILVNSIAGLAGHAAQGAAIPSILLLTLAPAALVGGWIGAELGSRRLGVAMIRRLLAAILLIASLKMLLG